MVNKNQHGRYRDSKIHLLILQTKRLRQRSLFYLQILSNFEVRFFHPIGQSYDKIYLLKRYYYIGGFCMGEVHYMISEAAKRVNVETHVLRYWEEELLLTIGRTEMGHRYYTEEDVQLFQCIKELKEQGMLLKDLKSLIPDILRAKKERKKKLETQSIETVSDTNQQPTTRLGKLQEALLENNKILESSISLAVSQAVIHEMDFLLQAKERQEEERYQKLDHLIRQQQQQRKETAKSTPLRSLRKVFEG